MGDAGVDASAVRCAVLHRGVAGRFGGVARRRRGGRAGVAPPGRCALGDGRGPVRAVVADEHDPPAAGAHDVVRGGPGPAGPADPWVGGGGDRGARRRADRHAGRWRDRWPAGRGVPRGSSIVRAGRSGRSDGSGPGPGDRGGRGPRWHDPGDRADPRRPRSCGRRRGPRRGTGRAGVRRSGRRSAAAVRGGRARGRRGHRCRRRDASGGRDAGATGRSPGVRRGGWSRRTGGAGGAGGTDGRPRWRARRPVDPGTERRRGVGRVARTAGCGRRRRRSSVRWSSGGSRGSPGHDGPGAD